MENSKILLFERSVMFDDRSISESAEWEEHGGGPTAPAGVISALKQGIKLHEAGKSGKGLRPETVEWAKNLVAGEPITKDKAVKMRAWHARHAVDRRDGWESPPTPGYVAFLLWGGDAGKKWATEVCKNIMSEKKTTRKSKMSEQSVMFSEFFWIREKER
jgi:hypothetical protein